MGVRFLDIRIKLVENNLCVFHGIADQKLSFDEVISDVKEFIEENPSEFIFLMIRTLSSVSLRERLPTRKPAYDLQRVRTELTIL